MDELNNFDKFRCQKCGECCKDYNEEIEESGILLFEWEKNKLDVLAEDLGIEFNPQPLYIYKIKDNVWITDSYIIKHNPCPFLKENKCLIHKDKPRTCKIFPLDDFTFFPEENRFNLIVGAKCKGFNKNLSPLLNGRKSAKEILIILKNYFGKEFVLLALQRGETAKKLLRIKDIVTTEKPINYETLNKKERENITILPLFTFCKKHNILSKQQIREIIKEHNNLEDVQDFSNFLDSL